MKNKLKNTLEHEVELLGRSISVLAIAGLLVAGGASAALLSSFGTVDGTAEVDQAVVVNDEGQTQLGVFGADYDGSTTVTAGATTVDTFEITNNLDSEYSPEYDSTLTVTDAEEDSEEASIEETGNNVDWQDSSEQVGIDTTYTNYFSDAGHDFDDVETSEEDATGTDDDALVVGDTGEDGVNYNDIDSAIGAADEDDTVFVQSGEGPYDGFTADVEGLTVASDGAKVELNDDGQVDIAAEGVTVEGFEISPSDDSAAGNNLVDVQTNSDFTVRHNDIHGLEVDNEDEDGPSGTGVYLGTDSGGTVAHNTIEDNHAGIGGTENFEGSINYNVFKSNDDEAIGVGDNEFSTEGNRFEDNGASFKIYDTNLYSDEQTVDANNNFFAEPFNIDYNGNEGVTVSASYQAVDSVPKGETVTVGVVNDFDLMINGAYDYSLTTDITTSEATE